MGDPKPSSTPPRKDPLPAFCFLVKIDAISEELFFKSVSGLKFETEVVDYRAGGVNHATYKLVGATKWSNIVLKRGFTTAGSAGGGPPAKTLFEWRAMWLKQEPGKLERSGGTITQLNTKLEPMAAWTFVDGWPCKFEISELDASKNEIVIETLEIAHHGIKLAK